MRREVEIAVPPYGLDHHFQGRAVLPAVEAMQALAAQVSEIYPHIDVHHLAAARFEKFLPLTADGPSIRAFCDLSEQPGGAIRAALITRRIAKTAQMSRSVVHAQMDFGNAGDSLPPLALDLAAALEGPCFKVTPERIYAQLVPFGSAYRNIVRPLLLTAEGALAHLQAPDLSPGPLGSPFVLDAAFHAACVWSQRFAGLVAFPVGIARRRILSPTQAGQTYVARILPTEPHGPVLRFDAWILAPDGRACEVVQGIEMRDVSGGRLQPPDWIRKGEAGEDEPLSLQPDLMISLIERDTVMAFADRCLSDLEHQRMAAMGDRRRTGYLAARLACKRLARKLSDNDHRTPPRDLETLAADAVRPVCAKIHGAGALACSVAHDRRFAVAAAGPGALGVDVEQLKAGIEKALHLFASPDERICAEQFEPGPIHAAIRIWSIKEAVAKALGISLAQAWAQTEVVSVGQRESRFELRPGSQQCAYHTPIDDHLVTLVQLPDHEAEAGA